MLHPSSSCDDEGATGASGRGRVPPPVCVRRAGSPLRLPYQQQQQQQPGRVWVPRTALPFFLIDPLEVCLRGDKYQHCAFILRGSFHTTWPSLPIPLSVRHSLAFRFSVPFQCSVSALHIQFSIDGVLSATWAPCALRPHTCAVLSTTHIAPTGRCLHAMTGREERARLSVPRDSASHCAPGARDGSCMDHAHETASSHRGNPDAGRPPPPRPRNTPRGVEGGGKGGGPAGCAPAPHLYQW